MSQQSQLNEVAAKLGKQNKILCCKLDALILASGGSPVLYNNAANEVVAAGGTYSSTEAHAIMVMVVANTDATADVADITLDGVASQWPVGVNFNIEATTVFASGYFTVENSSTARVIVTVNTA